MLEVPEIREEQEAGMQSAYDNPNTSDKLDSTLRELAQDLDVDLDDQEGDDGEDEIGSRARRASKAFTDEVTSFTRSTGVVAETKEGKEAAPEEEEDAPTQDLTSDKARERWKKLRAAAKAVTALKHISADHQVFGIVNTEKQVQEFIEEFDGGVSKPWYIMLPHSIFVKYWDILVMLLLMYVTFIIPVRVCFTINDEITEEWTSVDIFELILDIVFIVDVGVNFVTAFHEEKTFKMVVSPKRIAMRYITGWFFIDIIACIPINLILRGVGGAASESSINRIGKLARLPRMFRLLRLLRLMKLLRILRMTRIFDRLIMSFDKTAIQGFKVFFYVWMVTHLVACLWYLIGSIHDGAESWIKDEQFLETKDIGPKYVAALYWAFSTLTTVGFGDIRAQSDGEKIFSIFVMICGVTWYACIISSISSLMAGWDRKNMWSKKRIQEMTEFVNDIKLPKHLKERVNEYTDYCVKHDVHVRGYNAGTLLKSLSPQLRSEVIIHM
eukprot:g5483.t1